MHTDEIIIKVLGKATLMQPEIDQQGLRYILEEVLYDYNIQPIERALVVKNNMREMIALYLSAKKLDGLSENTLYGYMLHLRRFANFISKNVEDINIMDIRMHLAAYTKAGVKKSTLATEVGTLRSFFGWMEDNDYIRKSPMKKIKTPKVDKRLREALTPEQLEKVRDTCKDLRERALIEIFFSTGGRLEEIEKLNKTDINWQDLSVNVIGKGSKERPVYINAKAKLHLQKYLMSRLDECEALIVTERKPYRRLSKRGIERAVSKIGERASIHIYPHLIRHTTATCMLSNGAELHEVQRLLGHENAATTQIYAETNDEAVRIAHRKYLAN